ncbi:hypothetical protein JMJ77_0001403, partial [Colletotrichum scovillei]
MICWQDPHSLALLDENGHELPTENKYRRTVTPGEVESILDHFITNDFWNAGACTRQSLAAIPE